MSISVNNQVTNTYASATVSSKQSDSNVSTKKEEASSVVFEKSTNTKTDSANKIYNKKAVVAKLTADQEARMTSMQNLVTKLLHKQGTIFDLANGTNLADKMREAAKLADPETIKDAQASIAEDGYWGVAQTSDRLVSMAIALSGGDVEKADEMMAAIEKGYKQATKAWGEELPEICQKTLEATKNKMTDWKNGITTASDYSHYLS